MVIVSKGILFWLPCEAEKVEGRSYAQTTRFELAEWFSNWKSDPLIKLSVGIEDDFPGRKYIVHRLNQHDIPVHNSLFDTIDNLLKEEN